MQGFGNQFLTRAGFSINKYGNVGSRKPTDATFMPNWMCLVVPASAAMVLMQSGSGRSLCQSESTRSASHTSTHFQHALAAENGNSNRPGRAEILSGDHWPCCASRDDRGAVSPTVGPIAHAARDHRGVHSPKLAPKLADMQDRCQMKAITVIAWCMRSPRR